MLIDELKIRVKAGKGGDGAATFRTEKYIPFGGPDGGNGGDGGSVVLQVNEQYNTLLDIGYSRVFQAEPGQKGSGANRQGRRGKDLVIHVPKGTIIKDEQGRILYDLTSTEDKYIAAEGGRGGRGNASFKSARNTAPKIANPGIEGEDRELYLELKMMADIGLVGYPNAGKSSLVNRISSARPKVGDYPFTTLEPVLGIVSLPNFGSCVVADIPGLIDGAAKGRGLGHQFLRHIERTHSLLFVIDGFEEDAYEKFCSLRKELEEFHPKLAEKPYIIALNKRDLGEFKSLEKFKENKEKAIAVSAINGKGLKTLILAIDDAVKPYQSPGWK